MSDDLILEHGAPTLAGLKTGNLIACPYQSRSGVREDLRRLNRVLTGKGLRMIPLKYMEKRVLIYIYRPKMLAEDLEDPLCRKILAQYGYESCGESQCIRRLIGRLKCSESFPHEIGLFLGYPAEDVQGFIENRGGNSKLTGVWKVYKDPEASRRTFEQYRKCTQIYCRAYRRGVPLWKLAVSG